MLRESLLQVLSEKRIFSSSLSVLNIITALHILSLICRGNVQFIQQEPSLS